MRNPNDITAKYYDLVSSPFKGTEISQEEIELVKKLVKPKGRILDIGCGTGRHLLPLSKVGFVLTGIDSSLSMLEVLFEKEPILREKGRVVNANFLGYVFAPEDKFDLIILFWNVFNEICLTQKSARKFLVKCIGLLNTGGKILINSDNFDNIVSKYLDFNNVFNDGTQKVNYHWQTQKYFENTKTSISTETITISKNKKNIIRKETSITQRWWRVLEYQKIAKSLQLIYSKIQLKGNDELYILFKKGYEHK